MSRTQKFLLIETKTTSRWSKSLPGEYGWQNTDQCMPPPPPKKEKKSILCQKKSSSRESKEVCGINTTYLMCLFPLPGVWTAFWLLEVPGLLFPKSRLCWPVFQTLMLQNLKFCCNKHQISKEKQWKLCKD